MKLHEQRDQLLNERAAVQGEIQWMREHLASSKFQGELNDYINVRDVDAFCLRIRKLLGEW